MDDKKLELQKKASLDLVACKKVFKIHQSAISRNIEYCMTFSEVKRLLAVKKCYFTDAKLNNIDNHPQQLTFDRIDNDKGYVNGNVVACSREFNGIKADLTIEQIRFMVKGFKKKKLW